ncbi:tRNA (adenosine(37)-N6)-threonylcarbamoyltransferase complex dimerization subunit type 1 TsaB [Gemella sp. 19428wG2_WT2a]|nr:tRNA (adenosine(37)-N6)-threonylcarbamoyltransferase complex dimerization subunit type 1 TsaB [Gemella sp. 19428wG2_WT2a]TFU59141.1 tRNA (adenosine(37)-N6)-threonylcarbamoyltransferase complex dimerization subunit type 1 TsaB [Gemella sp. WT2a]
MVKLVLEASNSYLSIACIEGDKLLAESNLECGRNLSEVILVELNSCLKRAGVSKSDLTEIVAVKGPGSYTALRIVLSVAKVLSFSLNIPLKTISTLVLQSYYKDSRNKLIVPLIDGRRGNVFAAIYEEGREILEESYYPLEEIIEFLNKEYQEVIFIGPNLDKYNFVSADFKYILHETYNFARNFLYLEDYAIESDYYSAIPSYLRYTEAERNLKDDKNR